MTPPRPNQFAPETYVWHTDDGPIALLPARVARQLSELAGLRALRIRVRGIDGQLDAVLVALQVAAAAWPTKPCPDPHGGAGIGTRVARMPPGLRPSEVLTTAAAAVVLGVRARAVRRAIQEGRLPAHRVGHVWLLNRADLVKYRSARRRAA